MWPIRIKQLRKLRKSGPPSLGIGFATEFLQFRPLTHSNGGMFTMTQKFLALHFFAMGICLVLFFQNSLPSDIKPVFSQPDNHFRQTRFGWQDSRQWVSFEREFEETRIHPLWMAILLAFGVVGVFVWSTEEDEIANFFGHRVPTEPTLTGGDPTSKT